MLFDRFLPLFVGEPSGGAAGTDAPPEAPPASEPEAPPTEAPASANEESSAEVPEPAAGDETEGEPADLSEETVDYLIDRYGEKFRDHPNFKAMVEEAVTAERQKQEEAARKQPPADPFFNTLNAGKSEIFKVFGEHMGKVKDGELPDPDAFEGSVHAANAFSVAVERRAQEHGWTTEVAQKIGVTAETAERIEQTIHQGGKLESFDPLHVAFVEARIARNNASQNAFRLLNAGQLERALTMDAAATGANIAEMARLLSEAAEQRGYEKAQKEANKRVDKAAKEASENTRKELAAIASRANGVRASAAAALPAQPDTASMDDTKLRQRVAYGQDSDGNKVTQADRDEFKRRHPG